MIVKCENCQTRFKIPDDKVTEKGVKVRCTKCSHTFRVRRGADGSALIVPAAPSAAPPVSGVPENPFAQFAPPPGGEMFSQSTRVAPIPKRPEPAPAPAVHQEVTKRGPSPTEVTKRGPVPTRDDLAAVFGVEPEAVTNPAMAFGKAVSSTARTDPAAVYGRSALPAMPGFEATSPPPSIQIDAALPPGPPSMGNVPSGFSTNADTVLSSGPSSGNHPHAGPQSSAPVTGSGSGPGGSGSNPFASGPSSGGFPAAAPDHSLFDIPPPPPESASPSPALDGAAAGAFGPGGSGLDALAPPRSPMMSPPKPAGRPDDARGVEELSEPGAARRYAGLVTNLAVAAGLVLLLVTGGSVYLNEGKVDPSAFSKERMAALFASKRTAAVADVSNGLYETRGGRSVFFVRGVVHNRTDAPLLAKVRAEILDGAELVRAAEGMAGATPTPEDVFGIGNAADQAKLSAKLNQGARPVAPGAEAPFFLLFDFGDVQQSPDLASYRLRVTVSEGAMTADAAAPR
jgi:predicted Zn finger-like uncharacterized protein